MEPIFTLPFSEYKVATSFQKRLPKKEGFSVSIPLSRQQESIDLIIYNHRTKKTLSVQIKSSRSYEDKPPKKPGAKKYQHYSWFNNFAPKYKKGMADYYVLFTPYPVLIRGNGIKLSRAKPSKWWKFKILLFSDDEMGILLSNVKTKRGKVESKFAFGFDEDSDEIYMTRGANGHRSYTGNLFESKIPEIMSKLL